MGCCKKQQERGMRIPGSVVLAASLALCAAPSFAATTTGSANMAGSGNSAANHASTTSDQNNDPVEQQLAQSLQRAGFTHVRVEPRVFVVHAMNAQGEPVLMRIAPDTMEAVTGVPNGGQNGSHAMGGSGQQHASGNATNTKQQ
jgi:hypothetical protein